MTCKLACKLIPYGCRPIREDLLPLCKKPPCCSGPALYTHTLHWAVTAHTRGVTHGHLPASLTHSLGLSRGVRDRWEKVVPRSINPTSVLPPFTAPFRPLAATTQGVTEEPLIKQAITRRRCGRWQREREGGGMMVSFDLAMFRKA